MIPLAAWEKIIDASGAAPRIEALLPAGARSRQLTARTLLAGMCLAQADGRPAHLTRIRQALVSLPGDDQRRLGVIADWKHRPHQLTCRQTEYTFGLVAKALGKDEPDGLPSPELQAVCDDLLEESVPEQFKHASSSLAVAWTGLETFPRPPPAKGGNCADPEASWGHRKNNLLRSEDELFYGYYFSAGTMTREENGPAAPELTRRMTVCSCRHDPARALVPVLVRMPQAGPPPGDLLAHSSTPPPPGAPAARPPPAAPPRPPAGPPHTPTKPPPPANAPPPPPPPPHRRRARLRPRQGPRHQSHQPRLVPPHGPGTPDAVHRH